MLKITQVQKRFGNTTALQSVSLEVAQGEFFGLLGPNGAGKSTLMSIVAGLRRPDAGDVHILERSVAHDPTARLVLGFVPQSIALYPDLTAEENLRVFGQLYGLRGSELKTRIDGSLEAVQLQDRRKDRVGEFSGGMQRRLNIIASLLHRPKLLLCDEPTVGVDPQSRNAIFDFLKEQNRQGLTVIYSTHYMEEAERLCSRIGVIDHGKILALGTVPQLLASLPFEDEISFPATPETRQLQPALEELGRCSDVDGTIRFYPKPGLPLSRFYLATEQAGLPPSLFTRVRPTLEAVFLHLTGRTLRD
jgi:ABC-2 type transport system ATP-binding protein